MLAVAAHVQRGARAEAVWRCSQAGESQNKVNSDTVAEESEPLNPKDREARRAKNTRYNAGGRDLTVERPPDSEIFFEQVWPAVGFIPALESAIVVTGSVVKVQPYLSSDRSRVYTEIMVKVDDFLKRDRNNPFSATHTVVIDRLGGALKLKTGRIVRDDIQIDNLGKPNLGKRYMFFARTVNGGSDISLITSYELVDGKVFTNDSRPSKLISALPGVPNAWASEATFVEAVRQRVQEEVGQLRSEVNAVRQSPSDKDLMKQVEAFASSDATVSTKAWAAIESYDRQRLISELTRLYGSVSDDDYHKVLIAFTLCKLNHEYAANRSIVLSSLTKKSPYKRFYGDWAASLVHRLLLGGDKEVLSDLFTAAEWSDGAMSEELSDAYSDGIKNDPGRFLKTLAVQSESNRHKVYTLLKDNSLTKDESERVQAFLKSIPLNSDLHETAQETIKALQSDPTRQEINPQ